MTKRAIIYARVSSKRQADDGLPIESQLDRCRAKAMALGAEVVRDATAMSGQWARDRQLRRDALVRELRGAEAKRSKLYSVLELMGTEAPNLADMGPRLRELNDQIKNLERSIIQLEDELTGPMDAPERSSCAARRRRVRTSAELGELSRLKRCR
jgi:Resolvase, N terminal domain